MGQSNQQNQKNIKTYLPVIWQSILIISFVLGLVYFPVNIKFDAMSKDIAQIKKDHERHHEETKEKFCKVPDIKIVELQFSHIKVSLKDIQEELSACRGQDEKLQQTLQEILIKLK